MYNTTEITNFVKLIIPIKLSGYIEELFVIIITYFQQIFLKFIFYLTGKVPNFIKSISIFNKIYFNPNNPKSM
jgi:hypothetical protein